jgi:PAS domain S-box-containing protein
MKIFHLEDDSLDVQLVRDMLTDEFSECSIIVGQTREPLMASLTADDAPDVVVSDFSLPGFDGFSALALVREYAPDIPFVFYSGSIGEERAIEAVRAGAYDYVLKNNPARLPVVIRRALADIAQRRVRKDDERRLVELGGVIERSTEAIVVSDLAGRTTLWNDGAARLYGIGAAEMIGRPTEEIFSGDALMQIRTAHRATLETGEWQRELRIVTRDGRYLVIDLRISLVRDGAGHPTARLTIANDITEKKKLEEQFLRAQRLESLGLLAAGIAHDLNNILAPVLMAAPLLRHQATSAADMRVLDILENSAQRGSALVKQIIGFAQGSGGGFQLTQVKHLVRDVCDVIQASFPKSIILDEDVAQGLWPVQANPTQIHQILVNLAVNARDAMLPKGGTLRLRAENVTLSESEAVAIEGARPGAYLVLNVSDTGTGIPPQVLARIWEPFFTTKEEGKGTGLGLSTVRGIAVAHGGFVTVDTRIGHGTTFRVFLPAEKLGDEKRESSVAVIPRGAGELILIVDDEVDVCDVTAALLREHGYRVMTSNDSVDAIRLFAEHSDIRAVVSDINMPDLDGPTFALILHQMRADVKIMAITGLTDTTASQSYSRAEFSAIVQKPFAVNTLLTALHRILDHEMPVTSPSS